MARGTIAVQTPRVALIRARIIPIISTMAASTIALLPVVASWPILPPFGLLMLLAWRLLRPELWPVWIGLPLGLFDDLLSGQPIGSAMSLWTGILLILDLMDSYVLWRDYWIDWLITSMAIIICVSSGCWFAGLNDAQISLMVVVPQMILSILCVPIMVRLCAHLDRWRLPA